ncbi:hypothetical protein [Actinomycetospora atypica]|uniref:Uncharacterized protein n=1 Tax=Actinomycetospora atypica TaxID=1290095 RepID=A0ABV9YVV5_9PSEU
MSVLGKSGVTLAVLAGLVATTGTACAAPSAAGADGTSAPRTVPCPGAQCTVTVSEGDVIDLGRSSEVSSMTITDVGDDGVTASTTGDDGRTSTITSTSGGSNTLNGVSYRVTSVRDGVATMQIGEAGDA